MKNFAIVALLSVFAATPALADGTDKMHITDDLSSATNTKDQGDAQFPEHKIDIPAALFLVSMSRPESATNSKVFGGELQLNLKVSKFPFAIGLHGIYDGQKFNGLDLTRYGVGASVNYYKQIGSTLLYLGVKKLYYSGLGKTADALDCLYCSNVEEKYSGRENYASAGIIVNKWVIQIDKRISDNKSQWSKSANDPWGVGASYYQSASIPNPQILFHIGYAMN